MNTKMKILKIEKFNNFGYCNVCGENNLSENNEIHKLSFGRNDYANKIYLCTKCLNDFAEILQKHLKLRWWKNENTQIHWWSSSEAYK